MLDSVAKIESFTKNMDKGIFLSDSKTQSAVIMQLIVIGELAKKVSDKARQSVNLPWREISGFRDRAIHNYFGMDIEVIWDTVVMDVPVLKVELIKLNNIL